MTATAPDHGPSEIVPPLLADAMLGRLARYLRMLGCDVELAGDEDDDSVVQRVRSTGRRLVTRDQDLARRVPGTVLLRSVELPAQLIAVRQAVPALPLEPNFRRCTVCNAPLEATERSEDATSGTAAVAPETIVRPTWRCVGCGHRYWEGSHTERVRRDVGRWLSGART